MSWAVLLITDCRWPMFRPSQAAWFSSARSSSASTAATIRLLFASMRNGAAIIARLNIGLDLTDLSVGEGSMDFTNLEEKSREAKLDYGEAESLERFFNFHRERQGEPPIPADYSRLREQLSEIYPDIDFKLADHRIVAQVKDGAGGSLVELIGFVNHKVAHLATTTDFGSESLHVVFRADGIGVIKEDSWYEFFEHELDLEEVRRDCEDDDDAIDEFLRG